jgi:hypothetical protein
MAGVIQPVWLTHPCTADQSFAHYANVFRADGLRRCMGGEQSMENQDGAEGSPALAIEMLFWW